MQKSLNAAQIELLKKLITPEQLEKLTPEERELIQPLIEEPVQSEFSLYVDGAANLARKTAGIGGVLYRNGEEVATFSKPIGSATNNEAEYRALLQGIELALEMGIRALSIYADSELIVRQVNGQYKVKHPHMVPLHQAVHRKLQGFHTWTLDHVPREHNRKADQLSKAALRKDKRP